MPSITCNTTLLLVKPPQVRYVTSVENLMFQGLSWPRYPVDDDEKFPSSRRTNLAGNGMAATVLLAFMTAFMSSMPFDNEAHSTSADTTEADFSGAMQAFLASMGSD